MNELEKISNKLTNAFVKNKLINPVPLNYAKNINEAQKLRILCESKIKWPVIGFKAGGTAIPVLKKLGEKEPFYASIYKRNFLKNGENVKINDFTLGIELEVCFLIKKSFFHSKNFISMKNISKYITHVAPCIEVVGYRQKKKGIKSLGDLCSDFGANVKFVLGKKIKYKNNNVKNLKTNISNRKVNQYVNGNTNTVYINPMNSLLFVLKKIKKDKIKLKNDFYVFTGSSVGVVPILSKGIYKGIINKLGSVSTRIS